MARDSAAPGCVAGDRQDVCADGGLFVETGFASGAPRPGAGWRRSWNSRAACRRPGRSSPIAWRRRPRRRWRSWRHGCAGRSRPAGVRNARACCGRPGSPNPRNSTGTTGHRSASRSTAGARRSSRSKSAGRHEDVVLFGPPGTGKTHLAIALGRKACREGTETRLSAVRRAGRAPAARQNGQPARQGTRHHRQGWDPGHRRGRLRARRRGRQPPAVPGRHQCV